MTRGKYAQQKTRHKRDETEQLQPLSHSLSLSLMKQHDKNIKYRNKIAVLETVDSYGDNISVKSKYLSVNHSRDLHVDIRLKHV